MGILPLFAFANTRVSSNAALARRCVILLDGTRRKAERRIIDVWRNYRYLKARRGEASRLGRFGTYAEVVFR